LTENGVVEQRLTLIGPNHNRSKVRQAFQGRRDQGRLSNPGRAADDDKLRVTLYSVVGRDDDALDLGRATDERPGRLASPTSRCPGHSHTAASV
jgi:hypothetical protein